MKTVLLAHNDGEVLARLTAQLHDLGYEVIGAARTAGVALMHAAQGAVAFALVGDVLAGRRDGPELMQALRDTWGIRCAPISDRLDPDVLAALEAG